MAQWWWWLLSLFFKEKEIYEGLKGDIELENKIHCYELKKRQGRTLGGKKEKTSENGNTNVFAWD